MFDAIIAKVSEVCEVDADDIIEGCKLQSVVDARVLAVQYMRRAGLSSDDIAFIVLRKLGKENITVDDIKSKAKGVDKMFSSYSDRCLQSYAFCLMSTDVKLYCHEAYKEFCKPGMKELPN